MNWITELIKDNKHIIKTYGIQQLIIIWLKLIGYLVIIPLINLLLLWKVWWLGIIFIPITYLAYVITLQGQRGIIILSSKLLLFKNKVYEWFKK